jgi:two-component system cell cycle response regulator
MTEAASKLCVLVVDDSPVYRKLVEHTLEDEAYSPVFAKNGREALELYAQHAPSIVITDWMMPDLSGLELCQQIRADPVHPYTYIIVLTSISEKDNVVKGLAAGADDYLTKPFDPGEMLARIGVGRRTIDLHREIDGKNKLLEEMAHTDPLTSVPNRRAIEEWAGRQLRGAARHGYSLWVVHADLDSFKSINDNYGHDAGDQVLKEFAAILKEYTRASDISGRMGGDEFLLVLTHVDEKHIRMTVERLREHFASKKFSFNGQSVSVTASFGVRGFQGKEPPEFSLLVRQADKALYGAKRAGRNQIRIESPGILVP